MTPEELADLANELNTQDNRITSHPLFIVEQEKRIYGMNGEQCDDLEYIWVYSEDSEYTCEPDEVCDQIREDCENDPDLGILNLHDEEIDPEEWGYEQWFYVTEMEFKSAHLTERAANLYITQNSHRMRNPRTFVTSQYRCHEWNMVREHLMTDHKPTDAGPYSKFADWWKENEQLFLDQATAESCAALVWQAARMT